MAGEKKITEPIDYSFLKFGGLYDAILQVMVEACRRFGAEKAAGVISEFSYGRWRGYSPAAIRKNVSDEYGIDLTDEDIPFLSAICDAQEMVCATTKHLKEACHGR